MCILYTVIVLLVVLNVIVQDSTGKVYCMNYHLVKNTMGMLHVHMGVTVLRILTYFNEGCHTMHVCT